MLQLFSLFIILVDCSMLETLTLIDCYLRKIHETNKITFGLGAQEFGIIFQRKQNRHPPKIVLNLVISRLINSLFLLVNFN